MQIGVAEQISVPAEWAQQKAIWTAWPADPDQWNDDLATPRTRGGGAGTRAKPFEPGAALGCRR